MKKLKTIKEVNKERQNSEVHIMTFKNEVTWEHTGIATEFGGEFLEATTIWPALWLHKGNMSRYRRVKCSKTGKKGYWYLDGSVRNIINKVEWDKEDGNA